MVRTELLADFNGHSARVTERLVRRVSDSYESLELYAGTKDLGSRTRMRDLWFTFRGMTAWGEKGERFAYYTKQLART